MWQILPPLLPLIGLNLRFRQEATIMPGYNVYCMQSIVIENLTLHDTLNPQKQRFYAENIDHKRMKITYVSAKNSLFVTIPSKL